VVAGESRVVFNTTYPVAQNATEGGQ